jgi:hypothetical protein
MQGLIAHGEAELPMSSLKNPDISAKMGQLPQF